MRHSHRPARMALIQKCDKVLMGTRRNRTLEPHRWECNRVRLLQTSAWGTPGKVNMKLSQNPARALCLCPPKREAGREYLLCQFWLLRSDFLWPRAGGGSSWGSKRMIHGHCTVSSGRATPKTAMYASPAELGAPPPTASSWSLGLGTHTGAKHC